MIERVFKNTLTTVLGLLSLIFAAFLLIFKDISWEQFTAFLPFCITLIWAKDSLVTDIFKPRNSLPILLVSLLLAGGCCTQKRCAQKYPVAQSASDSSAVTATESVQEKDSITYLPADSSWLKALVECDTYGNVLFKELQGYKNGKNVEVPMVTVSGNVLTVKCKIDSMAVYNHYVKSVKKETQYRDRKVTETKYTNILSKWQKTQVLFFWIESALLLLFSFLFISKMSR